MIKYNGLNSEQQAVLDFFCIELLHYEMPRFEDLKKLYQKNTEFRSYTKHFRSVGHKSEELEYGFSEDISSHFQKLEDFFPAVRELSTRATDKLKKFVKAHAIYSPPHAQGLPLHYDLRSGVVFQLEGQKHWQVWKAFRSEPTPQSLDFDQKNKVFDEWIKISKSQNFLLNEGDLLFVPRGGPHRAFSQMTSSLHYNFALHETAEDLKSPY